MADRFSDRYSPDARPGTLPDAPDRWTGKQPARGRARANMLNLAAIPLLVSGFWSGPVGLATHLAAFGLITLSSWLTREGLDAQDAYNARDIAKRPALPRKTLGSVAMGLGVALATFDSGVVSGLLYGLIAAGLHVAAFGLDPMRDKGREAGDFQSDRVARAVDEAESHLGAMTRAVEALGDRALQTRLEEFQATARAMFRRVEGAPGSFAAARRYLGVYLLGARDATLRYAEIARGKPDVQARASYVALLDDLEANFAERSSRLLEDNRASLDVEIDVLRERLARETVAVSDTSEETR